MFRRLHRDFLMPSTRQHQHTPCTNDALAECSCARKRNIISLHLASVRHTTVSMTNPADRVEIITSVQYRRRWTAPEKVRMVEGSFEPGITVSLVGRRY